MRNNDRKTFKIVHLSDAHVDPQYKEGTSFLCESYLCCRAESGVPENEALRAGYWGAS
jgi:hypothetical protein